ncbi:MAG: cell division protein ZapE [Deinococcales bacterium]
MNNFTIIALVIFFCHITNITSTLLIATQVFVKILIVPVVELLSRNIEVRPEEMLLGFTPPARFAKVRFSNYSPNIQFPSQANIRTKLEQAIRQSNQKNLLELFKKNSPAPSYYLDGGFGVGKTHLLAASWHEFNGNKHFLSFAELTFFIGALGMDKAITAFSNAKLICIDEFELDDVGNTLIVSKFLSALIPRGTRVITTSNTLPEQLGEGRFNTADFKREIQGIAAHFESYRIDGADYRHREGLAAPEPFSSLKLKTSFNNANGNVTMLEFDDLLRHLGQQHPIRYNKMLEGLNAVYINGIAPIQKQDDALRFVHFIDKLYDREIRLSVAGISLEGLFLPSYRNGGYAKKYSRCLSRLGELMRESMLEKAI